jgi:hypothetical protein
MRKWIADLLDQDNDKVSEMTLLAILSVIIFLALTVYTVVIQHQPWRLDDYGDAIGKVLLAAAVGMGIKSRFGGQ